MIDYDADALSKAALKYQRAATLAGQLHLETKKAQSQSEAGLLGDGGYRLHQKLEETALGLSTARASFYAAAKSINILSADLGRISQEHTAATATVIELESSRSTLSRLLDAALPDEFLRIEGKLDSTASELYVWRRKVVDAEVAADEASQLAANKLNDLAEWAKEASARAFRHTPLGFVANFFGAGPQLVTGLGEFLEDHLIQWTYDFDGFKRNWQASVDGFLYLTELVARDVALLNPGTMVLSYRLLADDDQGIVDYFSEQLDMNVGLLKAFVPWDQFDDNPGSVVGIGLIEGLTLLTPAMVAKLGKVQKAGQLSKIGRTTLAVLQGVDALDTIGDISTYGRIVAKGGMSASRISRARINLRVNKLVLDGTLIIRPRIVNKVGGAKFDGSLMHVGESRVRLGYNAEDMIEFNGKHVTITRVKGFPDFSEHAIEIVELPKLTWDLTKSDVNRTRDFEKVEDIIRLDDPSWEKPEHYTWHHAEDGKTLQLIPTYIHNKISHHGGVAVEKETRAGSNP